MIGDPTRWYIATASIDEKNDYTSWQVVDWDERRTITIEVEGIHRQDKIVFDLLGKHLPRLPSDTYKIDVSTDGELHTSNNPRDDPTRFPWYPAVSDSQIPAGIMTCSRSELETTYRLGPQVDLTLDKEERVVFKYYFIPEFKTILWDEINIWMRLPRHPYIVPFHKVVFESRGGSDVILGFTTKFIDGGTLEENKTRLVELKWLKQLISVVNDLNFKHNISHQDIALRNLLIDEEKDNIALFDFNFAVSINSTGYRSYNKSRDDVKGVVFSFYELITRDYQRRRQNMGLYDVCKKVLEEEWTKHRDVSLDHDVAVFQTMLLEWVHRRERGTIAKEYAGVHDYIGWPEFPMPPVRKILSTNEQGEVVTTMHRPWSTTRSMNMENNIPSISWQRPAEIL